MLELVICAVGLFLTLQMERRFAVMVRELWCLKKKHHFLLTSVYYGSYVNCGLIICCILINHNWFFSYIVLLLCTGELHDGYQVQCCGKEVVSDRLKCCGNVTVGQAYVHNTDNLCCGSQYVAEETSVCCTDEIGRSQVRFSHFILII